HPAVSVRETLRSNSSLRLQNTRPEPPRRPQRRRPSVLVTFVNEVLSFQTAERVLLPQLADSVDGLANGLQESFPSGANCLLGEHFFDIHFERHPSRLGLCRQPIRYIYPDLHKCNFSMRFEAVASGSC